MKIGMNIDHDVTVIFCQMDDFIQEYNENIRQGLLGEESPSFGPKSILSISEIMTILVLFQFFLYA